MNRPISFLLLGVFALWSVVPSANAASSVTRNGITWTFDRDYPTGTYCTGDPWVVGPVTITAISPTPSSGRNGTVLNPAVGNTQGYDNRLFGQTYSDALNVGDNLPLSVAVNTSVVSCISSNSSTTAFNLINVYAVLTVVSSAPVSDAFRPPYSGSGSKASNWRLSGVDYSKLNTLARSGNGLAHLPPLAPYASDFSKTWYEQSSDWTGEYYSPMYMARNGYGREHAIRTADACLLLNLDFSNAEKAPLLVGVVQYGIDLYGLSQSGMSWPADGGHKIGRLAPLALAANVLNDSGMRAVIAGRPSKFQEYGQTFFVSASDVAMAHGQYRNCDGQWVLRGANCQPVYNYTSADLGMPEWGIRHEGVPELDNNIFSGCDSAYRDVAGCTFTGTAMALRVMGMRAACNWEAFFQYQERHRARELQGGIACWYNPTPAFHAEFYAAFRNASTPKSGPETNAPVLSSITTNNVGATSATITWNTDEPATSGVDYGLTVGYGERATNSTLSSSHSITLSGLQPSTTYRYRVISTDGSNNRNVSVSGDYMFTTRGTNFLSTPVVTPSGASSIHPVQISIAADAGASVYYSLDGSSPSSDSALYTGPFVLTTNASLRAVAMKAGFTNSEMVVADFEINQFRVGANAWRNIALPALTNAFTVSFDLISPQSATADAVVGLSRNPAASYPNLAVISRLNAAGTIDVRNGGAYMATNTVNYDTKTSYRFTVAGSTATRTFTATVATNGGSPVLLWSGASFRSEQALVDVLNNLALYSAGGECIVSNVVLEAARRPVRPSNLRLSLQP